MDTSGDAPGARGSTSWSSHGTGPRGLRRTVAACWHSHWDVLAALFEEFPDVRVISHVGPNTVTYRRATFAELADATADVNVGAPICPRYLPELCGCDGGDWWDRALTDHAELGTGR